MKYSSLIGQKNSRSCKLIFGIPILLLCAAFYFVSIEDPQPTAHPVFVSSHIFEGCPSYDYKWDDPEILKLVEEWPEEAECHREPGMTVLRNGEVHFNKEYPDHQAHTCKARCIYRKSAYEPSFGPWCTVGVDCQKFECDFIYINCWKDGQLVHFDVLMQIFEHKRDRAGEFGQYYNNKKHQSPPETLVNSSHFHPDVYIIVLDSAGRYPAKRQLKKTYKFLLDEMNAIDFTQFNRVAYGSRENAFASFFGIIGEKVDRTAFGGTILEETAPCEQAFDAEDYIQFEYEDAGYRPHFAYDHRFDLLAYVDCKGMIHDPSTHFARLFQLVTILSDEVYVQSAFTTYGHQPLADELLKKHIRNETKCGQKWNHMIKYTELFVNSYEGIPKFGILWTGEAHGDERGFRISDRYHERFLRENKKRLEDAFLIVMGDHGQREGKIVETTQGKYEASNNLLLFSVPKRLRGSPLETMVMRNSKELFSMHDLHATLIDIIRHQPSHDFLDQTFKRINGSLGNSWLRAVDPELPRSCRHLPIPSQYCTCNYGIHQPVPSGDSIWMMLPKLIQSHFNRQLAENNLTQLCENVTVREVTLITKVETEETTMNYHAEFYTTRNASFSVDYRLSESGQLVMAPRVFVRVNRYGSTADCLATAGMGLFRPMCYCKIQK